MFLKSVIVIGGGLAGLAAGVALAESGWRVRLFEQRPFLGGRATSYVLPDGEHVDNCQHVTLGCCTNLDDFYRRVGSAHKRKVSESRRKWRNLDAGVAAPARTNTRRDRTILARGPGECAR